jgi:hypothetical protein
MRWAGDAIEGPDEFNGLAPVGDHVGRWSGQIGCTILPPERQSPDIGLGSLRRVVDEETNWNIEHPREVEQARSSDSVRSTFVFLAAQANARPDMYVDRFRRPLSVVVDERLIPFYSGLYSDKRTITVARICQLFLACGCDASGRATGAKVCKFRPFCEAQGRTSMAYRARRLKTPLATRLRQKARPCRCRMFYGNMPCLHPQIMFI